MRWPLLGALFRYGYGLVYVRADSARDKRRCLPQIPFNGRPRTGAATGRRRCSIPRPSPPHCSPDVPNTPTAVRRDASPTPLPFPTPSSVPRPQRTDRRLTRCLPDPQPPCPTSLLCSQGLVKTARPHSSASSPSRSSRPPRRIQPQYPNPWERAPARIGPSPGRTHPCPAFGLDRRALGVCP